MRLNAKQIAHYTGGEFIVEPIDGAALLTGLTWDSRDVQPGWLYVALPGERVDGHEFIESSLRSGAGGVLVTEAPDEKVQRFARELGVGIIQVPNTFHAISDLAREWRGHLKGRVVAITGSTGKTTTKNLVRDVCASQFNTVATRGNQNNELGVPATLLAADPETQVVVVEMGMRGLGQITELCEMVRPDWGIITNVSECHIELLHTRENIARAKAELFEALPAGTGKAFLNPNCDFAEFMIEQSQLEKRNVQLISFGAPDEEGRSSAAVWPEDIELDAEGRAKFTICAHGFKPDGSSEPTLFNMEPDTERAKCHMSLRGEHNVENACAAAAVGCSLGINIEKIAQALAASVSEAGRQEILKAREGFTIVNDAYNANPDSMRASLTMFCAMQVPGRRYAVLGDMGELGDVAVECHRGVGRVAAELPLDGLVAVGELAVHIAEAARESGMHPDKITQVRTIAGALDALEGRLEPDDAVLVKASHFMELDRLVEGLAS